MRQRQLHTGRDSSAFDKSKQTVEKFVFEQNQSTVNVKIRNFIDFILIFQQFREINFCSVSTEFDNFLFSRTFSQH